ncbi:MAG: D-glycero-beta-D-manno-heptose 1-phosphate adenylyltransferase, partial [Elusimicrobia bacterium CG06_land_8_20_14_3_00_38_11]
MNSSKIKSQNQISEIARKLKKSGKKIVFTNGCFDILHIGHIRLLEKAKSLGDILIVGLNSDASVKKIKGKHRPIIPENER